MIFKRTKSKTSNNDNTVKISKKITLNSVSDRIPQVFIDYLWQLADLESNICVQTFVLRPSNLNHIPVQDIFLVDESIKQLKSHRIFGIDPMDAVVVITFDENFYTMDMTEAYYH